MILFAEVREGEMLVVAFFKHVVDLLYLAGYGCVGHVAVVFAYEGYEKLKVFDKAVFIKHHLGIVYAVLDFFFRWPVLEDCPWPRLFRLSLP